MPLDFAYAVHSDVGDTTVGVKINGELRPLRTPLQNGDVVEVVRGTKPVQWTEWRALTVTGRARSAIRRHLRQGEREEFARAGRAAVDEMFAKAGKSRADVQMKPVLERFGVTGEDDLFIAVGKGRVTGAQVLEAVFPGLKADEKAAAARRRKIEDGPYAGSFVRGADLAPNAALHFAECCSPVPGDRIVGIAQEDGAVAVHTIDCSVLAQFEERDDLWRDMHWTAQAEQATLSIARLQCTIRDAPGVLGQVCTVIGEAGGNIVGLNMHHRQSDFFDVDVDVEVRDARHLTLIAAALRACPPVETVERAKG